MRDLSTINARSDNLTNSNIWRPLLPNRRCVVLADGYAGRDEERRAEIGGERGRREKGEERKRKEGANPTHTISSFSKPNETNRYFEWKVVGGQKQPYFIHFAEPGKLLTMAGLWDCWVDPETGRSKERRGQGEGERWKGRWNG